MMRLSLFRCPRLLVSLLLVMVVGCVSDQRSVRPSAEMRAKEICDAVDDYLSKNTILDPLLRSKMQEIRLKNVDVSSDGVIRFGENWRYEAESKRLFNKGAKIGGEITCFVIDFQPLDAGVVVRDAKTVRYYGTEQKP